MYQLIDCGHYQKWEQWGPYSIIRPCPLASNPPRLPVEKWFESDVLFDAQQGWIKRGIVPDSWHVSMVGLDLQLKLYPSAEVGLRPEQQAFWRRQKILKASSILNLWGQSGVSSVLAALSGSEVTQVDPSTDFQDQAAYHALAHRVKPHFLIQDPLTFLRQAAHEGQSYEGVIIDYPYALDAHKKRSPQFWQEILRLCQKILPFGWLYLTLPSDVAQVFFVKDLIEEYFPLASVQRGDILLASKSAINLFLGTYVFIHYLPSKSKNTASH
jgi:23S rRNA G2069 N7-methylase RlmK/C1962 C5-methylase RlmI